MSRRARRQPKGHGSLGAQDHGAICPGAARPSPLALAPKNPLALTPKETPRINIHYTPKRTKQRTPLQLTSSLVDPPDPRSTRERARRTDGSGASRTQKGGGAIKAINGRIPQGWRGRGGGRRQWRRGKRKQRGQPDDARRQENNFWAGLAMQRLIKSSCRARSTPFYLIRYERRASQVQLVNLLEEVSLLTGASSFIVFALRAKWTTCVT